MKKLILFQFLCGLFNYGSAQTVYSAPNVCMDIPMDLNRLVRNLFLEGFIAFKRDIAKTTVAQNTMNSLDEDKQRTINSVTELRRELSNHRAMFLEKMTNLSNAIDDREERFKLMDTEVISLQDKYTDQKDNITDLGNTLKILLREQEWMVSNVSELHEEIRKYALTMERLQVEIGELKQNITLNKGTPSSPVTCPIGWSMFETSCYMAFNQQLSWNDASMKCLMSGSKLVEIETKAENDFLTTTLPNFKAGEAYWTGGKDDVTEGLWVWISSGATFGFLNWNQGEPNDAGGIEDCLQLYKRRGRKTYWNDNYCERSFNFICEQTL